MTPNRVVAVLTPTVFAPVAGLCSSWLAAHIPGVDISSDQLQAIFIAGALIALAPAVQWLHGWQKWEARQDNAEHDVEMANVAALGGAAGPTIPSAPDSDGGPSDDADDLEGTAILDDLDGLGVLDDELFPEEELAPVS